MRSLRVFLAALFLVFTAQEAFPQIRQLPPPPLITGMNGVIEKYERDAKVEKHDLQIILNITWTDTATYVSSDGATLNYTVWRVKYVASGRAVTRIYRIPQPGKAAKIETGAAQFKLTPKTITAKWQFISKEKNLVSDNVVQQVPATASMVCGRSVAQPGAEKFALDFTLTAGMFAATREGVPMGMFLPFLTTINPSETLKAAQKPPAKAIADFPVAMPGTFKVPITVDNIDFAALKTDGSLAVNIPEDSATGPGILGGRSDMSGHQTCTYEGNLSLLLGMPGSMLNTPPRESPKSPSTEPGTTGPTKPTEPPQPPNNPPGKGQAPRLTGNPPETDRVRDVKAKAERMLNRALKEMNINKTAADFLGWDYVRLGTIKDEKLLDFFIKAGAEERVTISNGPAFYYEKLDAFYAKHRNLEGECLVDSLLTLIIMEYDWTEPGLDKDILARQYLGDSLYKANKARLGKK